MSTEAMSIAEGLQKAIDAEIDGYHFYMMAMRSTPDAKGREVFEKLAQDELERVRFLRAQYAAYQKSGRPDRAIKLGQRADLSGTSPIFSEKIKERIGEAHFEMSALSIGVQLELSAVHFYQARAAEAVDDTIKEFYTELADWESGHYHALLNQQEGLKQDYWAEGGFSPF